MKRDHSRATNRRRHPGRERGSAVIETVIAVPALMLFVGLIIFTGRVAIAHQGIEAAAADAARSASIARTPAQAVTDATAAAGRSLNSHDVHCISQTVHLDTSGFASPVGTPASVSATLTCLIDLSDLSVPNVPGTRAVSVTMRSPIDTYRER